MTKNITVTDMHGNLIGTTYPKRAKGLVKNGRAEYIGDCEIRLNTQAPIINDTEVKNMSKVIDFNAREFKFDENCTSNVGSRMIVTDSDGDNVEMFEIGDWNWSWTQIKCSKHLEKNTDYVFRFAMTGGINDTEDAVSQFIIYHGEEWEDRLVYPLDKSRFKPVLSKRTENDMLRIYEIPFNSGDFEDYVFMFVAQKAVAAFFTAKPLEKYASLEDYSYDQWRSERMEHQNTVNDHWNNNNDFFDGVNCDLSGAVISEKILEKLLNAGVKNLDLSGSVIQSDDDDCYDGNDTCDEEDFDDEDEDTCDEEDSDEEDISCETEKIASEAIKSAYENVKAQYEAAPKGSMQRSILKQVMKGLSKESLR